MRPKKTRITAKFPPMDLLNQVFELGGPTGLRWRERTPDTFPSASEQAAYRWNQRFAGKPAGTLRLRPSASPNPVDDDRLSILENRLHARTTLNDVSFAVADLVAVLATGTPFNTEVHTVTHDDGDQWNCDPAHLSIVSQDYATHPAPYVIRRRGPDDPQLRDSRLSPLKTLVWDTFVERPGILLRKPGPFFEHNLLTMNREEYGPVEFLKDSVSLPESLFRKCAEDPPNLVQGRSYAKSKVVRAYPRRFGKQFLKYLLEEFSQFFKLRSRRVYISGNPVAWRDHALRKLVNSARVKEPAPLDLPMAMTWRQYNEDPEGRALAKTSTGEVTSVLPQMRAAADMVNRFQPGQYPDSPQGCQAQYPDAPEGWVAPPPPPGIEPVEERPRVVAPWEADPNYWDRGHEVEVEEDDGSDLPEGGALKVVR